MLLKSEICLVLVVFVWNFDLSDGQACGSALTGRGKIVSEGHPNSYPSFFDCDWTIEAGPYDTVHIMFEDFNIEPGEACEFDYLEISAMGSSKKFCGDKISDVGDNGRLSLRGPVSLKMASDDSVNLRGFSLFYRVVPGDSPAPTTPPVPTTTTPAMTTTTTPVVTCDDDPCQNEGECTMVGEAEYYCFCKDGFEGNDCEINIDDCVSNPCENGGTCIDGVQSWSCQCVEGFIGENCGIDYDECRANPCKNGATCEDRVNAFTCHCSTGWTGWDCATDIDDCTPNPCMNYGVCEDHLGFHTCICHPRYTGENCTILIEITTTTTTPVPTTTPHLQTTTPSLPAPPTTIASQPRSEPTEPSTDDLNNSEEEKPNEPGFENRPEGPTTQPNSVFPDVTTAADDLTSPSPESLLDSESNPGLSDDSFRPTNAPLTNNTGTTSSTGNYINATEMPGNSTTTVQNSYNTTISGEEQENAEEKDGIASYVIAAVVVVTTLGSIASSILYYYKSSIKSRKIQPSDSDSSTQAKQQRRLIEEEHLSPTSVDSGISQDVGVQIHPEKGKSPSKVSKHSLLEEQNLRLRMHDKADIASSSALQNSQNPLSANEKRDTSVPETSQSLQSGNLDVDSKEKKPKKEKKSKKKSKKKSSIPSSLPEVFSPRPSPATSSMKLPPLKEEIKIIEESSERIKLTPLTITPSTYSTLTPQATPFSFPNKPAEKNIKFERKRKIARRSRGSRPKSNVLKPSPETHASVPTPTFETQSFKMTGLPRKVPEQPELSSESGSRYTAPFSLDSKSAMSTKQYQNPVFQPNFTFQRNVPLTADQSSGSYFNQHGFALHPQPSYGEYFNSSQVSKNPPVLFSQLQHQRIPNNQGFFLHSPSDAATFNTTNYGAFPGSSVPTGLPQQNYFLFSPQGQSNRMNTPPQALFMRDQFAPSVEEAFESRVPPDLPHPLPHPTPRPRALAPLKPKGNITYNFKSNE